MARKNGSGNGGRFAPGNPGGPGRPRKARTDNWVNPYSGYGTDKDRRRSTYHVANVVTDEEAVDLWVGNDIAARAIECYPQDAMRGGYEVRVGEDQEAASEIRDAVKDVGGDQAMTDALEYERAYGGAAIWPVMFGAEPDLMMPLDPARCVAVEQMIVLEPRELIPLVWKDGEVEVWRIQRFVRGGLAPMAEYLHRSRLVYFPGIRVTKRAVAGHLYGHGHSVLTRMAEVLKDFGISWAAAGAIVHDFSQGVLSIENLASLLATAGGEGFMARVAAMDFAKSTMRSMVIDKNDTFVRQSTPVTGLSELLDRFAQRLAAAVGMPVTKLMGMSPGGMNATGESDSRMWYDAVAAWQVDKVQKPLEQLLELLMVCREGPTGGEVPDHWCVEWNPLWEPTQAELLTMRKTQADIDHIYFTDGVIDADEIARNRWREDGSYSFDTVIDWEERARLAAMAPPPPSVPPPGTTNEPGDITNPGEGAAAGGEGAVAVTVPVAAHERTITRADHVEQRDGKWVLIAHDDPTRVLGTYDTQAEADAAMRRAYAHEAT